MPPRDEDGCFWHPDLDLFMRGADGGPPRQEESDWMDMDAFGLAGFEVHDIYVDAGPEEFDPADEAPDGDGWLLVAVAQGMDGGMNALWVRPAVTP